MPTHRRPRAAIAACRRVPKVLIVGVSSLVASGPSAATSRAAVVGSCSSAAPTCTATAPARAAPARRRRSRHRRRRRRARRGRPTHLGQAAQRQRPDRRAAQPGVASVGHRGRQRLARRRAPRLPPRRRCARPRRRAATSGRSLASTGTPRGSSRCDRGDRGPDLEGLARRPSGRRRAGVGRRDVDLDGADAGRGAQASRQLDELAEAARGHRDHDAGPLLQQPGQLGGQEAVDAGVRQPGGVQQPRRASPRAEAAGRRCGRRG